jgi:hypothetical protein
VQTRTEYALAILGKRIGPWRAEVDEAKEDAVRTGNGTRDRYSETVYLTVPADIISRHIQAVSVRPSLYAVK